MNKLNQISLFQVFCLVVLTQVGVHVLTIPYEESRFAGYDSWISLLIGGVISQFVIWMIYLLNGRHPNASLPQFIFGLAGKPLGSLLNLFIAVYCLGSSLIVCVSYSDVISRWVLFSTPWFVLTGISLFTAAYIASSSLISLATVTQSIMLMFLLCLIIIFVSGMGKGDVLHFLPVGMHGFLPILKGVVPSLWAYAGYELLLYVFPYINSRKKRAILITVSAANGFTTLFYVLISVIVTFNFSENQLKFIPEPMIFLLRQFNWPVVQSLDILFMTIWLSVTTVTLYVYLFLSARYLAFVGVKENPHHRILVWMLAAVCYIVGLWGEDRQRFLQFSVFHNAATIGIIAIVPAILLAVSLVRGRRAALG
ncbi:GerAB/ArcD/ProY family transporter [Paenibacillus gansuensis]|uniref:GerAB/ArcD/ProY family transporter n=1 Tax=Paenibacillus gansuensis TaxID=306542 RepID=A0ABW5PB60_9BACL